MFDEKKWMGYLDEAEFHLNELLGVLLNEEETMEYTAKLPTEVGLYRHRWDFRGQMREQVLFVGYTNVRAPRLQGSEPNAYMPRNLKCCKPDEHLHADRLTPKEWGGWWARIETPNAQREPRREEEAR